METVLPLPATPPAGVPALFAAGWPGGQMRAHRPEPVPNPAPDPVPEHVPNRDPLRDPEPEPVPPMEEPLNVEVPPPTRH
ncbi:hypothetical protein GPA19_13355 [Azoarcus indigens]|nr:hypothetical protein [Azoarcus indigens]NMG65932.1 hypothetical protein [Azoarcus indigens]